MLEWSKRRLKKNSSSNSLADAYDDLLYEYKDSANYQRIDASAMNALNQQEMETFSVDGMKQHLEQQLIKLNLRGISLSLQKSTPQTWEEMRHCYDAYQKLRPVFLKFLGFHDSDSCLKQGFNKEQIVLLQQGITPENYNTHLKIPFDFGGMSNMNNLSLVQTHPIHDHLHQIIDIQIENDFLRLQKMIFIPWFEGRLYHAQ